MNKLNAETLGSDLIKVNGGFIFHLQEILDDRGITKYKFSKISHIRYDTVCNYCKGKVSLLNMEYLKIICYVLKCNVADLVEYTLD